MFLKELHVMDSKKISDDITTAFENDQQVSGKASKWLQDNQGQWGKGKE